MSGTDLLQILVSGISNGSIYALLALAYTVGFMTTRVINFALGDLLMIAAMVGAALSAGGVPVALAVATGLVCAAVVGVLIYVGAVKPVMRRSRAGFAWLVTTLGASFVLEATAALIWGSLSRPFPALLSARTLELGGVAISYQDFLTVGITIALVGLLELTRRRSLLGRAAMAVAVDRETSSSFGIVPDTVAIASFALAGLLAGVAGVLVAPIAFANPYMGAGFGLKGFVAMMIGGLGSPAGAVLGGVLLGLSEAFAVNRFGSAASDWFPFVLLMIALLVRPRGLFGTREAAVRA